MLKHIQPYPKYSHIPKQFKPKIPQHNPTYHRSPLHIPNNSYMSQHKTAYPKIFFHPILMSLIVQYTYKKWLKYLLSLSDHSQFYWPHIFSTARTQLSKSGFNLSLYVQCPSVPILGTDRHRGFPGNAPL